MEKRIGVYLSNALSSGLLTGLWGRNGGLSTFFVNKFSGVLGAFVFAIAGGLVGWFAWGGGSDVGRLGLLVLLPLAWGLASSRLSASMLVAGYFLAGARGIPGGTAIFFGNGAPSWVGFAFLLGSSILLTLPWVALWSPRASVRPWRFVVAACVAAMPPLGLIGWLSPIAVAGVLFPGLGWIGLVFGFGAMAASVARSGKWIVVFIMILMVVNLISLTKDVRSPPGWQGVDTRFPKLTSGDGDDSRQILAAMQRVAWVEQYAKTVPANSVRVLPETILGSYSGVSEFALMSVDEALAARGSRLMVGAELPQPDGRYSNVEIVLGARGRDGKSAVQGIPVPVSMWKPWASDGAVADVFGHGGMVEVTGVRAGVLICYEQLLTFSALRMMLEKPDVLVGTSNVWWVSDASIPAIQWQTMNVYGRLFGIGVVGAVNS